MAKSIDKENDSQRKNSVNDDASCSVLIGSLKEEVGYDSIGLPFVVSENGQDFTGLLTQYPQGTVVYGEGEHTITLAEHNAAHKISELTFVPKQRYLVRPYAKGSFDLMECTETSKKNVHMVRPNGQVVVFRIADLKDESQTLLCSLPSAFYNDDVRVKFKTGVNGKFKYGKLKLPLFQTPNGLICAHVVEVSPRGPVRGAYPIVRVYVSREGSTNAVASNINSGRFSNTGEGHSASSSVKGVFEGHITPGGPSNHGGAVTPGGGRELRHVPAVIIKSGDTVLGLSPAELLRQQEELICIEAIQARQKRTQREEKRKLRGPLVAPTPSSDEEGEEECDSSSSGEAFSKKKKKHSRHSRSKPRSKRHAHVSKSRSRSRSHGRKYSESRPLFSSRSRYNKPYSNDGFRNDVSMDQKAKAVTKTNYWHTSYPIPKIKVKHINHEEFTRQFYGCKNNLKSNVLNHFVFQTFDSVGIKCQGILFSREEKYYRQQFALMGENFTCGYDVLMSTIIGQLPFSFSQPNLQCTHAFLVSTKADKTMFNFELKGSDFHRDFAGTLVHGWCKLKASRPDASIDVDINFSDGFIVNGAHRVVFAFLENQREIRLGKPNANVIIYFLNMNNKAKEIPSVEVRLNVVETYESDLGHVSSSSNEEAMEPTGNKIKSDKEISSSNASMVKQDSIEQAPVAAAVSPIIRNTTHCTSTTVTKPQSGHDVITIEDGADDIKMSENDVGASSESKQHKA